MLVRVQVHSKRQEIPVHEQLQLNALILDRSQRYPRSISVRSRMSLILFFTGLASIIVYNFTSQIWRQDRRPKEYNKIIAHCSVISNVNKRLSKTKQFEFYRPIILNTQP